VGANGVYSHTFAQAIASDFVGTMAVGIEGYRNQTVLKRDGSQATIRDAGLNDVFYFHTAGGTPTPRRKIVDVDNCNSCHGNLSLHGGNRNNTEQCVLCHMPGQTDVARRPDGTGAPESVHFKTMIHRIHTGEENTEDLTIYGIGNRPHNFNEVVFPGDLRNCTTCHIDGTQQLPLPLTALPSLTPRGLVGELQPTGAACLSCHTTRDALVHAILQTNILGESCAVCHGPNRDFAVDRVHAR
jgi:OmcA/MtrC family decaheme c-type cytochrome